MVMDEPIRPIHPLNLEPFQNLIQKLDKSIEERNYQQIVHDASAAISQVFQSQLLILFDVKSQALSMLGSYTAACESAQYMIDYAPALAAGYIRQGNLHTLYGHQTRAIEIYDAGIRSAALDSVQQVERLEKSKAAAAVKDEKRVDFIAELPVEVVSSIFSELNQEDKVSCLTTSKTWRNRLLDCSSAWKTLSIFEIVYGVSLMNAAEQIGRHVKTLKVWTDEDPIRRICFDRMEQGCFDQINTLEMKADQGAFLQSFTAIPSRFWQTAHALQKVDFDLTESESEITVANILGSCPTITELSYAITALQKIKFGDFSEMEPHTSLSSLKLKAHRITGEMIAPLLQQCPRLKRLIASECQPTVLNAVHKYCPNMQVLAYNAESQVDQYLPTDDQVSGLRVFYANHNELGRVPYESLMPLLYKSMETLVNVFVYLPSIPDYDNQYVYDNYPDFKLPKVKKLSFWPLHGIQRFMLRAIQDTTTLRHLSVSDVHDLEELLTTLLDLRPLETFRLSYITTRSHQESLVKLFERYAELSKSGPSLKSITIRHCNEITDQVFMSMAKIQTLRDIAFVHLRYITNGELGAFFKALQGKLVSVRLGEMDIIYNNDIIELGKVETLETIHLENLSYITDGGIRGLIDNRSPNLSELIIKECLRVSVDCMNFAKGQVKISFTSSK